MPLAQWLGIMGGDFMKRLKKLISVTTCNLLKKIKCMNIQVRFKATKDSNEKNFVYTANNLLKFLIVFIKAKRKKASAILCFFD